MFIKIWELWHNCLCTFSNLKQPQCTQSKCPKHWNCFHHCTVSYSPGLLHQQRQVFFDKEKHFCFLTLDSVSLFINNMWCSREETFAVHTCTWSRKEIACCFGQGRKARHVAFPILQWALISGDEGLNQIAMHLQECRQVYYYACLINDQQSRHNNIVLLPWWALMNLALRRWPVLKVNLKGAEKHY